jgi:hypothetical protein
MCTTGWTGDSCAACDSAHQGPLCTPCPGLISNPGGGFLPCNGNGYCPGNGSHAIPADQCVCALGWDPASNCGSCAAGYRYSGFGCDQCATGWRAIANGVCNDCSVGYFGPACAPCPGLAGIEVCSGHGACDGSGATEGSGACTCASGWLGASCSVSFGVAIGVPVGGIVIAALLVVIWRRRLTLGASAGARATAVHVANPLNSVEMVMADASPPSKARGT